MSRGHTHTHSPSRVENSSLTPAISASCPGAKTLTTTITERVHSNSGVDSSHTRTHTHTHLFRGELLQQRLVLTPLLRLHNSTTGNSTKTPSARQDSADSEPANRNDSDYGVVLDCPPVGTSPLAHWIIAPRGATEQAYPINSVRNSWVRPAGSVEQRHQHIKGVAPSQLQARRLAMSGSRSQTSEHSVVVTVHDNRRNAQV